MHIESAWIDTQEVINHGSQKLFIKRRAGGQSETEGSFPICPFVLLELLIGVRTASSVKKKKCVPAGVAQWIEHQPANQRNVPEL